MIFLTLLRVLCLCYAGFLIFLSIGVSLLAASVPQGEPHIPMWKIMMFVIGLVMLLASGFLYASLFSERLRKSAKHRVAACVLLAQPIAVGILVLLAKSHPEVRSIGWFFLVPAVVVFLSMAWPGLAYIFVGIDETAFESGQLF